MKELITIEQAGSVIAIIAITLPAAGLIVGAIAGAVRRRVGSSALLGLACGLSGPAMWAMWRIYNGIAGHYGLDSVKGLLVNLALFVVVGLVVGLVAALAWRRATAPASGGAAAPAAGAHGKRPS